MSEKRVNSSENDPSPKVQLIQDPKIATASTPSYQVVSVKCGRCDRTTTVVLCIAELPIEIQSLFDSIHYDSENCPNTEEAVAREHEHSPEEQAFKLQLKTLIEPRKWNESDSNVCNDAKWLIPLDINPGKRRGGKVGFLQDFDIFKPSPEAFGDLLLKSTEIKTTRVRHLPAGAMLTFGSFFVPESWILEAKAEEK
jgi:hypothetical protein